MFEEKLPIGALDEMESEVYWFETYGHSLKAFIFLRWFFTQEITEGVHSITLTGSGEPFVFDFQKENNVIQHLESIQQLFSNFSDNLFSLKSSYMIVGSQGEEQESTEIRVYKIENDEVTGLNQDQLDDIQELTIGSTTESRLKLVVPKKWSYDFRNVPRGLIT